MELLVPLLVVTLMTAPEKRRTPRRGLHLRLHLELGDRVHRDQRHAAAGLTHGRIVAGARLMRPLALPPAFTLIRRSEYCWRGPAGR